MVNRPWLSTCSPRALSVWPQWGVQRWDNGNPMYLACFFPDSNQGVIKWKSLSAALGGRGSEGSMVSRGFTFCVERVLSSSFSRSEKQTQSFWGPRFSGWLVLLTLNKTKQYKNNKTPWCERITGVFSVCVCRGERCSLTTKLGKACHLCSGVEVSRLFSRYNAFNYLLQPPKPPTPIHIPLLQLRVCGVWEHLKRNGCIILSDCLFV